MEAFTAKELPDGFDAIAPDGSEVRVLSHGAAGSMAHFRLPARQVSRTVAHRSLEEIWYFLGGSGSMWLRRGELEQVIAVHAGVSLVIPPGTAFQFRSLSEDPLDAVGVTMPPWTDDAELLTDRPDGPWTPTV